MEEQEKVFFQTTDVTVTQSRFLAGRKTYAMRNISSVEVGQIKAKKTGATILIIVGIVLLMPEGTRVFGGLLAVLGLVWFLLLKDRYSVRINSNSGEADGYVSKDKELIQKIVNAVNEAIIGIR